MSSRRVVLVATFTAMLAGLYYSWATASSEIAVRLTACDDEEHRHPHQHAATSSSSLLEFASSEWRVAQRSDEQVVLVRVATSTTAPPLTTTQSTATTATPSLPSSSSSSASSASSASSSASSSSASSSVSSSSSSPSPSLSTTSPLLATSPPSVIVSIDDIVELTTPGSAAWRSATFRSHSGAFLRDDVRTPVRNTSSSSSGSGSNVIDADADADRALFEADERDGTSQAMFATHNTTELSLADAKTLFKPSALNFNNYHVRSTGAQKAREWQALLAERNAKPPRDDERGWETMNETAFLDDTPYWLRKKSTGGGGSSNNKSSNSSSGSSEFYNGNGDDMAALRLRYNDVDQCTHMPRVARFNAIIGVIVGQGTNEERGARYRRLRDVIRDTFARWPSVYTAAPDAHGCFAPVVRDAALRRRLVDEQGLHEDNVRFAGSVLVRFVFGTENRGLQPWVEQECARHGDCLLLSKGAREELTDGKIVEYFKWCAAAERRGQLQFRWAFKVDDDSFVWPGRISRAIAEMHTRADLARTLPHNGVLYAPPPHPVFWGTVGVRDRGIYMRSVGLGVRAPIPMVMGMGYAVSEPLAHAMVTDALPWKVCHQRLYEDLQASVWVRKFLRVDYPQWFSDPRIMPFSAFTNGRAYRADEAWDPPLLLHHACCKAGIAEIHRFLFEVTGADELAAWPRPVPDDTKDVAWAMFRRFHGASVKESHNRTDDKRGEARRRRTLVDQLKKTASQPARSSAS